MSQSDGKRVAPSTRTIRKGTKRKKSAVARRRQLLLIGGIVALVFLIGVVVFNLVVRPPDISAKRPSLGGKEADGEGPDYTYDGDITEPFIEDPNKTRKDDYFTFLICGTDNDGTRADTIMVAAFDVNNGKVNMVNIPRDTMSNVKRSIKKINGAFIGGVDKLQAELEMLLGMRIDRYLIVDFQGFIDLVDAIDGVDYNVPVRMLYTDPTQDLYIDLMPGQQHLDGEKAIQFIRFRKNNRGVPGGYLRGDIERIEAQQSFLRAVASKLLSPSSLLRLDDIAKAVLDNTKTDLTMGELMWLGLKATSLKSDSINMMTLPGRDAYLWEPDFGHMQSYYVPEEEEILEMVNAYINPYKEPITDVNLIDISRYSSKEPSSSGSGNQGGSDKQPDGQGDDEPPAEPEPGPEEGDGQGDKTPQEPEEPEAPDGTEPLPEEPQPSDPGQTTPPDGNGEVTPPVDPVTPTDPVPTDPTIPSTDPVPTDPVTTPTDPVPTDPATTPTDPVPTTPTDPVTPPDSNPPALDE